MQRGIVKWFGDKGYGFINMGEGQPDLFFHYNGGRDAVLDTSAYPPVVALSGYRTWEDDPQTGDELVYELGTGHKGPRVETWTFADMWDALEGSIPEPRYRVRSLRETSYRRRNYELIDMWDGSDLVNLALRFPPSPSGNDSLLPYFQSPDGRIKKAIWFERLTAEGWEDCPDPRPGARPSYLTDYADRQKALRLREAYDLASVG